MKPNLFANHHVRATTLGFVVASLAGAGSIVAQQAAPVAPGPVIPGLPSAPVPPATAPVAPAPAVKVAPVPAPKPPPVPGISLTPSEMPPLALTRNLLDEELSANPQAAAKTYEAMIASFDQQRETAAQAIFRLGESYRRMGRVDEARAMYARILREFVDFPDLAKMSQRILTENAPTQPRGSLDLTTAAPNPAEEDLIRQEITLLEKELADNESLIKSGLASASSGLSLKREILQLKQRLARSRPQDWPTPTAPPLSARSNELKLTRPARAADTISDPQQLEVEIKDIESQIRLLTGNVPPQNMSTQIIKDPRFADLKAKLEATVLDASGTEGSDKAVASARDRLAKWMQEIYLPELESTLAVKKARLEALEKRSELRGR
jgi:hypothetical protein